MGVNITVILQLITTLVWGIIAFFSKDKLKKLEEHDSKNENRINCIEKEFSEFKEKMPLMYTTREDQLRAQASLENRIEKLSNSMEQGFERINTKIEGKLDRFIDGVDQKVAQISETINKHIQGGGT